MPKTNNRGDNPSFNQSNRISSRPQSVNSSTRSNQNAPPGVNKKKNIFGNLLGNLAERKRKSEVEKNNSNQIINDENQKHVKVIDNSLDHRDAMDFLDLMQEQKSKFDVNHNNHLINFNSQNNNNPDKKVNVDLHFNSPLTPDSKITPNVAEVNNLIANSEQALKKQRDILGNMRELNKKFSASETEIQKLTGKLDSEEFAGFSDKYAQSLDKVIDKLKNHFEEMENMKFIREENKNLKYKLEIMNIDKNDAELIIQTKISSVKNFIVNEMNDYIDALGDLGFEVADAKINANEYNEDHIKAFFEKLKKMMKNIKATLNDNENKINCLNSDKQNLEDEIKYFKSKVENLHKKDIQSDPNLHFYLRQQYEEELDYFKHQNSELQKKLQELRYYNSQIKNIDNNNNNNNKNSPQEEYNNKIKYSSKSIREMDTGKYNENNSNHSKNYISGLNKMSSNNMQQVNNRNDDEQKYSKSNNNNHEDLDLNRPIDKNADEDHKELSQSLKYNSQKNLNKEDKKYSDSRSFRSHLSNQSNKNIKSNQEAEDNIGEETTKNLTKQKYGYIDNSNPFLEKEHNKNEDPLQYNNSYENYRNQYDNRNKNLNAHNDDLEYYRKNKGVRNSGSFNYSNNYSHNVNQNYNANSVLNSNELNLENKYSDYNVYYSNNNENYPKYYNY